MKPSKLIGFAVAATLVLLMAVPGANAQPGGSSEDDMPGELAISDQLTANAKKSFISGDVLTTILSEYNPRGLIAENQGVISQTWLDLYARIYEGTGFIQSVTGQVGFFWVLTSHVQETVKPTDTTPHWFEFDVKPAVAVAFAKRYVFTLSYIDAYSPSGAFHTARSLNSTLDFNDSDLLGAFALHPHLTILRELPSTGQVGLRPNGWYYEPGISPSYVFSKGSRYPVTFVFPASLGLGSQHFYAGNFFGYANAGVSGSVPLAFVPAGYGTWTATAGYNYSYLGTALAREANAGSHHEHVFFGTISLTF